MTIMERATAAATAEEILERCAVNKGEWAGWADHLIRFKVGPATAELHSSYDGFRTVYSVRVKPKRRGQGHGRRLMDVIVAYAEATGCGLNLSCLVDNEPAVRLYASVGFRVTATRGGDQWMRRYPTRIPSTPEWDRHFEAKALRLEHDHEPRQGGDFWVGFFDALYKAQLEDREDLGRDRYTGSANYKENTRRLSCDATGARLIAAGWTITRTEVES